MSPIPQVPMVVVYAVIFSGLSILVLPEKAAGAIHYVTEEGSGAMDGTSWANAAPGHDLQSIIDTAMEGDSVWVACGTYFATTGTDRSAAFHLRDGIALIGSFTGTETSFSQRVLDCGPCSTLSGDIGIPGAEFDNSYTIVVNIGLDSTASMDGFRVAYGYDNRPVHNHQNGLGGGVYNGGSGTGGEGGNCSPVFRNCVFEYNYATYGAGMFNNGHAGGNSAPLLINCIFTFNHATVGGGGMDSYGWDQGSVAPRMYNCIFFNNTSADRAGAMYCWGGRNGNCSPVVNSCSFINNTSVNIAGGIIVDNSDDLAGNPPFTGTAEIHCTNSIFWGNTSGAGPQFYILGDGHFNGSYTAIDTLGQTSAHPVTGPGTGNQFAFPALADTADILGPDSCWMTHDDGLALAISSAAINSGDSSGVSSPDLALSNRIIGAAIDIGPYEYPLLDTVHWAGTVDSSWFNPANWLPARVPDSTQVVNIPGDPVHYPFVAGDTAYCKGLIANEGVEVRVGGMLVLRR